MDIHTSTKAVIPDNFTVANPNPLHFHLVPHLYDTEGKYIEIETPDLFVLTGFHVQVKRDSMFRVFEVRYRENSITWPDKMNKFMFNQSDDEILQQSLYEDDSFETAGSPTDIIEREILLPYPVETNKFRIDFIDPMQTINLKMDIIGMKAKERYNLNRYLDEQVISRDLPVTTMDFTGVRDLTKDNVASGGSVDFYFAFGSKYDLQKGKLVKKCKKLLHLIRLQ